MYLPLFPLTGKLRPRTKRPLSVQQVCAGAKGGLPFLLARTPEMRLLHWLFFLCLALVTKEDLHGGKTTFAFNKQRKRTSTDSDLSASGDYETLSDA